MIPMTLHRLNEGEQRNNSDCPLVLLQILCNAAMIHTHFRPFDPVSVWYGFSFIASTRVEKYRVQDL